MSENITPEITEENFDLDGWIAGATGKERRVTIYAKQSLVGELDALREELRKYHREEATGGRQRGLTDRGLNAINGDIRKLMTEFESSAITVRVKGMTEERAAKIRKTAIAEAEKARKNLQDGQREALGIRAVMAEAIVFPKINSIEQMKKFADAIGDGQYVALIDAYNDASYVGPELDAAFLLGSSDDTDGEESS